MVSQKEGMDFAQQNGLEYFECSAVSIVFTYFYHEIRLFFQGFLNLVPIYAVFITYINT